MSRDDIGGGMSTASSGVSESLLLLFDLSTCFLGDAIGGKRPLESPFPICSCFSVCFVLLGILAFTVFQLKVDAVHTKYTRVVLHGPSGIKMVLRGISLCCVTIARETFNIF